MEALRAQAGSVRAHSRHVIVLCSSYERLRWWRTDLPPVQHLEEAMARYSAEHKEATRRRIVETAGRRLKRDGIDGSGIATLMADAGLTNRAFYRSEERRVGEGC